MKEIENATPKNPDISLLIKTIASNNDLVVAEGDSYVIISSGNSNEIFVFTKNDKGYQMEVKPH